MNESAVNRKIELLGSVGSWLFPLIIYLFTIAPMTTAGDAGEFITDAFRFSMAHPPGYPLYILLLKIWSFLPVGLGQDPFAFKCNLFSAVCMAATCGVFYKIMRMLSGLVGAALAATLLLALSRTLWKFAVVTEVYSLNMLLTALVVYGLAVARVEKKTWGLIVTALAFGLGLAHHQTILFLVPFIIALWPRGKDAIKTPVVPVMVCLIAPLALYLLLPILAKNDPLYTNGFTNSDFVQVITREEYRNRASVQNPAEGPFVTSVDVLQRSGDYIGRQFGWLLLPLAVAGWFMAPRGRKAWALWGAITVFLWVLIVSFFSKGSPLGMPLTYLRSVDEFMIPVNMFIAMGFAWLLAPVTINLTSKADLSGTENQNFIPSKYIPFVIVFLMCVIPFFLGLVNFKYSSMSHHTYFQDQARNQLLQVPENGILVSSGDQSFMFDYLQIVRGIRKDVTTIIYPFSEVINGAPAGPDQSLANYINGIQGDHPVFFAFVPPAEVLPYLSTPKAYELEGVAYKLIDRLPDTPDYTVGNPVVWTTYWSWIPNDKFRNLDPGTLASIVPDTFEYETFALYAYALRNAVTWLIENGYTNDNFTMGLLDVHKSVDSALGRIDYPYRPPSPEQIPATQSQSQSTAQQEGTG